MSFRSVLALLSVPVLLLACDKPAATPNATPSTSASIVTPAASAPNALATSRAAASSAPSATLSSASAANPARQTTVGGELEIRELKPMQSYELLLGGTSVVRTDMNDPKDPHASGPQPSVVRVFDNVSPFDQVAAIRWDGMGNACNGYGYSFLSIKKDGSFKLSKTIDFCGGPEPQITQHAEKVTFVVPAHSPNRGTGTIPAERWVYENGDVKKK